MRRAILKRYLARSRGGVRLHPFKALRALATAASTSFAPASDTRESTASLAGLIVSKCDPDFAARNVPPMKSPYSDLISTLVVSGAGAYSHTVLLSTIRAVSHADPSTLGGWLVKFSLSISAGQM